MDKKQIPTLLALVGIAAAALVYFLYFQPTNEEIERLKAEDMQLQARITELETLRDQRDFFIEETERFSKSIDEIYDQFPENVMAEDAIRESIDIEDGSNVTMMAIEYDPAEAVYNPIATSVEGMKAAGLGAAPIMEQTAGAAEGEEEAPAPAPDPNAPVQEVEGGFNLMQQIVKYSFTGDLNQFERAALAVIKRGERDVISMVALVYDESTGLLTGEMDLNKFYVTGRNLPYEPATFNVPTGSRNLFSTYKQSIGLSGAGSGGEASEGGAAAAPE